RKLPEEVNGKPAWKNQPRWELGLHVISQHLPTIPRGCSGCATFNPGAGFSLAYRLSGLLYLSSQFNFFAGEKRSAQEALFGVKFGPLSPLRGRVLPGPAGIHRV